ncbi:MAG: ABC transporter ATP-binding protein [Thermomicrobiales bacterium]
MSSNAPHRPGMGGPAARFAMEKVRPKSTKKTLIRIWSYVRQERQALIACTAMLIGIVGFTIAGPYLLSVAIDDEILEGDMSGLTRVALIMLGAYAATALLQWAQSYIMTSVAQKAVRKIRKDLFEKLQTLPLSSYDKRPHGDLMSRLTNDIDNINVVLTESLAQLVTGLLTGVGVALAMSLINPLLAVIAIGITVILSLVVNRVVASRTRAGFRAQQAFLGTLNGIIEETISGQKVVKAHNREPIAIEAFAESNQALRTSAISAQTFAGMVGPLMNMIGNLSLLVVAFAGGLLAINGRASVGTIAGFLGYTRQFSRPLNDLATTYNTFQSAIAGAERVFELLDEIPEIDAHDAVEPGRIKGHVAFDNVSFEYVPGRPILKGVSLEATPGQAIALVGPTGAGKTTIVNLLSSFYAATSGDIRIDGRSIDSIKKEDLRRQMGIVLQDTYMFSGTVRENIRYGRLDATDEEIVAAATMANADQFIHRLPHGYETVLSERASNVSQGQRQLLAIARAILADPAILILDEATSSVDTRTEKTIQEAMLRLMHGRTSFVIAHRLSTIRNADMILVVVDGEIIERGSHEDLLLQNGFYASLYSSQFESTTSAGILAPVSRS